MSSVSSTARRSAALPWSLHPLLLSVIVALAVVGLAFLATRSSIPFFPPNSEDYLEMARGNAGRLPFANRLVLPWLVRHLASSTDNRALAITFFWVAGPSLFLLANLLLLTEKWSNRFGISIIIATLVSPFSIELFRDALLPDLFHSALVAVAFFAAASMRTEQSASLVLGLSLVPLMVVRESTSLLGVCCIGICVLRRRWTGVATTAMSILLGSSLLKFLRHDAVANIHHMGEAEYLALKVPFNALKNLLGVELWTDSFAAVNPAFPPPLFKIPISHGLGAIHSIGVCAFDPMSPLATFSSMLSALGTLPAMLLALVVVERKTLLGVTWWRLSAIAYGVACFVIGPMLGAAVDRLVAYGWPMLYAANRIGDRLCLGLSPRGRAELVLVHLATLWLPWWFAILQAHQPTLAGNFGLFVGLSFCHVWTFLRLRSAGRASDSTFAAPETAASLGT